MLYNFLILWLSLLLSWVIAVISDICENLPQKAKLLLKINEFKIKIFLNIEENPCTVTTCAQINQRDSHI